MIGFVGRRASAFSIRFSYRGRISAKRTWVGLLVNSDDEDEVVVIVLDVNLEVRFGRCMIKSQCV
jgi:hypothetical protein